MKIQPIAKNGTKSGGEPILYATSRMDFAANDSSGTKNARQKAESIDRITSLTAHSTTHKF